MRGGLLKSLITLEEDQQLLKVGFEYVIECNDIKIYRIPMTFAELQS